MRPRRGSRFDAVPPELAAWFRGECDFCWYVVLPVEDTLLPSRWRSWKRDHPHAKPPPGYEWLDDLDDPRHPGEDEVRAARRLLTRAK
jgi:hypothetical protein